MPQDRIEDRILARPVARPLGVSPEGLTLRRIPTGKFNETYLVEGGPAPLVLRVAPPDDRPRMLFYEHRMMRQVPGLHALLRDRTAVPVPASPAHDFGHAEIDRDYLLMERLPGKPISYLRGLTRDALGDVPREVGRCLRQVHGITGDRYGYVGDHSPMEPQPDRPSAFHVMWNPLLDGIDRCGGYSPEEAARMRRLLDKHMAAFDRPVSASPLQMDVWAENIPADERGRLGRPGGGVRRPRLLRRQRAAVLGGLRGRAGHRAGGRGAAGLLLALRGGEVHRHPADSPGDLAAATPVGQAVPGVLSEDFWLNV